MNWDTRRAAEIIDQHRHFDGPVLPVLRAIQEAFGCIPEPAIAQVAEALNLSRAEIYGVVSFYHDFRREPAGRVCARLCRAEACQSAGADALAADLRARYGLDWHGTTRDGRLTLEPVFCLGLCSVAPAALVNDRLLGRLDLTKLDAAIQEADV
jgi:formate dehydrogenase subunit gamma